MRGLECILINFTFLKLLIMEALKTNIAPAQNEKVAKPTKAKLPKNLTDTVRLIGKKVDVKIGMRGVRHRRA